MEHREHMETTGVLSHVRMSVAWGRQHHHTASAPSRTCAAFSSV